MSFFIQADRLGISSRFSVYIIKGGDAVVVSHHTEGVYICRLDDIQNFVLMICNSYGIDDIQCYALIFLGCFDIISSTNKNLAVNFHSTIGLLLLSKPMVGVFNAK